ERLVRTLLKVRPAHTDQCDCASISCSGSVSDHDSNAPHQLVGAGYSIIESAVAVAIVLRLAFNSVCRASGMRSSLSASPSHPATCRLDPARALSEGHSSCLGHQRRPSAPSFGAVLRRRLTAENIVPITIRTDKPRNAALMGD